MQPKDTTLKLQGCYIHGVAHMAAVTMEGGNLRMEGMFAAYAQQILPNAYAVPGKLSINLQEVCAAIYKPRCTAKCTQPSDRFLASVECTLTNCQVGLNVHEGVCVVLRNNDISFNEVGLIFDGYGIIQDNKMWGNLHRSTIDLGKEALARAKVRLHASSSPSDCPFVLPNPTASEMVWRRKTGALSGCDGAILHGLAVLLWESVS